MKFSRSRFKYAFRYCKKPKKKSNLINLLMNSAKKIVWQNRFPTVNSVDNISGEVAIAEVWWNHYESILNCVDQIKYKVTTTLCKIKLHIHVSVDEVADAIQNLKKGKSSGSDGLTGEAFIYSRQRLHILLSLGFTSMLTHGYLPKYIIDSLIIPLIKNKNGILSGKNNNRPITHASVVSKIFKNNYYLQGVKNFFGFQITRLV